MTSTKSKNSITAPSVREKIDDKKKRSRKILTALKKLYPEADHDSWTETYEGSELYEWFLSHRRGEEDLGF